MVVDGGGKGRDEVNRSWAHVRLGKRLRKELAFIISAPVPHRRDIGGAERSRREKLKEAFRTFFRE